MGERQISPHLSGIRADHVGRYRFAASRVSGNVADLACGVGYGARMLHDAGCSVMAVDMNQEAINYGRRHYPGPGYLCADAMDVTGKADAVVSFETIEHVEDGDRLVKLFRDIAPVLIASVPNEKLLPFARKRFPFHQRHYTPEQFEELLRGAGWEVQEWWCQRYADRGKLEPGTHGRTIIAVCE